jgi:hypothetical protein
MGKQEILDELNEFLNIPQFERIIFHKVEELKLYLKDEIDLYRSLKQSFKKTAYGDMEICDDEDSEKPRHQVYHFELNSTDTDAWVATGIEPSPPPGCSAYDIIPEEIIQYMNTFETAPDRIESRREFMLPALKGKAFDLRFTRYSDHHILGTIKSYRVGAAEGDEQETMEPIDTGDIYHYEYKPFEDDDESNFKEFFYYMQKYPALKAYFFTELHMKMKPLIMANIAELTVSSQPVGLF